MLPGAKRFVILTPILVILSYCCFHAAVFIHYAWLQDYEKFSVLRTELILQQNRSDSRVEAPKRLIPKIIHQTWRDENIPAQWQTTRAMCKRMYSDYEHRLWTNENSRQFIAKEYNWFLRTYDKYPFDIQRADAARYFILYHYGGVYLDLDVGCLKNFRSKLMKFPMVLPVTQPVGVSNDVMGAAPGHPFLKQVLHELPGWSYSFYGAPYLTVFLSTGPAFLSFQAGLYMTERNDAAVIRADGVVGTNLYFLDTELYASDSASALFYHIRGDSWHSFDAKLLSFLYNNHLLVIFGIIPIFASSLYFCRRLGESLYTEAKAGGRRQFRSRTV